MSQAILFKKCLGLNDARAFGTLTMITNPKDPDAGSVELVDCMNLTTTSDGCLEKLPALVEVLDTGAPILGLSADRRLFFGDGTNTKEWTTGTTIVNRFPAVVGPVVHTPVDVRVSGANVYKNLHATLVTSQAVVGQYTGPAVTKPFSAMPKFKQAFVYNAKLYAINLADPRFLQYSEDYAYGLWALGDNHIGSVRPCLQGGAIPGVVVTTHADGISVYRGTGPHDFDKKFYPCAVIDGTLFSGFVSKVYGFEHIFLCDDGVYVVGQEGAPTNVTVDQTDDIGKLNTSYTATSMQGGKYLAVGNSLSLEYDFKTKTLLKRGSFGITLAALKGLTPYFAVGDLLMTPGTEIDTGSSFACSMVLPFSDFSAAGIKSITMFRFTGTCTDGATITATDQQGSSWTAEIPGNLVNVAEYIVPTPRGWLGNHISVRIDVPSGAFRIEKLTAEIVSSSRTR